MGFARIHNKYGKFVCYSRNCLSICSEMGFKIIYSTRANFKMMASHLTFDIVRTVHFGNSFRIKPLAYAKLERNAIVVNGKVKEKQHM